MAPVKLLRMAPQTNAISIYHARFFFFKETTRSVRLLDMQYVFLFLFFFFNIAWSKLFGHMLSLFN